MHHLGVSLFSNCGAGDTSYGKAGIEFRVLAELDRRRLRVAALNHTSAAAVWGDLRETWEEVLLQYQATDPPRPDLLAACPPCQGMSTARRNRGPDRDPEAGARDGRNLLVLPIAEVALALRPRVVVVENVPQFLTRLVPHPKSGAGVSAARLLLNLLRDRYEVFPLVADLADYGVPQNRSRAFLTFIDREEPCLGWLLDKGLTPYPKPRFAPEYGGTPVTLSVALKSLGASPLDAARPETAASSSDHGLHSVPVLSERLYQMVDTIPPGSGASAWENSQCLSCEDIKPDPDDALCPVCGAPLPRPVVPDGDSWRLVKGFRSSSYRRMHPDKPASTVTTANGRVGSSSTIHPWENRVLSAMECAHIQTFPVDFDWGDTPADRIGVNEVRAMIGEAVPPLFTEAHGRSIEALLRGGHCSDLLSSSDRRTAEARRKLQINH